MKLFPFVLSLLFSFGSCSFQAAADFSFEGRELVSHSKEARDGVLNLSQSKPLVYTLKTPEKTSSASGSRYGIALSYRVRGEGSPELVHAWEKDFEAVLRVEGGAAWSLPLSPAFLGDGSFPGRIRYTVPLTGGELRGFSVSAEPKGAESRRAGKDAGLFLEIESLEIVPLWYGFVRTEDVFNATPFVFRDGNTFVIDPPGEYMPEGNYEAALGGLKESGTLTVNGRNFAYRPAGEAAADFIVLPTAVLPPAPCPLSYSGEASLSSMELRPAADVSFPLEPIIADPGIILNYPAAAWRSGDYELFAWDRFSGLLIFDTKDYATQDRLFKRLAFFTEKAGFRGRLARDEEIAGLHGWNAHDYRPRDLARFFGEARRQNFPLNREERALEEILLARGIVRRGDSGMEAGEGGIISVSRESGREQRVQLFAHEAFHGIFFIHEEFQDFCRERWRLLEAEAKSFLLTFFDFSAYDINDDYLVVNEFMAYCLQLPVSFTPKYFGEIIPSRLVKSPRRLAELPPDAANGTWPLMGEIFQREARALAAFTENRYGLSAGRVWRIGL